MVFFDKKTNFFAFFYVFVLFIVITQLKKYYNDHEEKFNSEVVVMLKQTMRTFMVRIALNSNLNDVRLQNKYGAFFNVDVDLLKEWLMGLLNVEYSLVIHDRDNTLNKPHLHLVVRSKDSRVFSINHLRSMFPVGYIEECRSYDACLLYLLHRGHANKGQYCIDDLFTNVDYLERFPFLKEVM